MAVYQPFEVEITADSLTVKSASKPSNFGFLALALLGCYLAYEALRILPNIEGLLAALMTGSLLPGHRGDVVWACVVAAAFCFLALRIGFELVRSLFPAGESMTCDRTTLTVGKIPQLNFHGVWSYRSFAISRVKRMRFAAVSYGRYGGITGLKFSIEGKTIKLLAGLESPEASRILSGLEHLGINIVRDPAMPMMVEMVESRRKSKLGIF